MSYVEAAGADPTVCASRAQMPVNGAASKADSTAQSAEEFASVFALTRQSLTWLNGLLDSRADQIAAGQRRQQRVNDALSARSRNEKASRPSEREPGASAARVDRLRASVRDHAQTADRAPSDHGDRQNADDAGRADKHAVDESKPAPTRHQQQSETTERSQERTPETTELPAQQQVSQNAEQETATTADSLQSGNADGVGSTGTSSSSPGANGQAPAVPFDAPGSKALTVQTQVGTSAQSVQVATATAGAKGGETGTGVAQDFVQASTAIKAAEGSAKPGGVTLDFQNVLTQTSKSQAAGPTSDTGQSATSGKGVLPETIKLAGAESVEQLARVVRSNLGDRHASMVLRLDPPELGQLRVDVRMHDQVLLLRFQAETQAGHDALQTRLTDLRAALEQHGIHLDRVEVEFRPPVSSGSQNGGPDGQQYDHGTGAGGNSSFGHAFGYDGSASGSFDADRFPSPFGQTQQEMPPVENNEPVDDDVARPAETGVDLIV